MTRTPWTTRALAVTFSAVLAACSDDGTLTTDAVVTATVGDDTGTSEPATSAPTSAPTTTAPTTSEPGTTEPVTATDSDSSTGPGTTTGTTGEPVCADGTIVCDGEVAKICDGMGGFHSEETCPNACAPDLGCVECVPGEGVCDGNVATHCNEEGSGYVDTVCDDVQGVECQDGQCVGACAPASLGDSYIGCDYYSVVTANAVGPTFTFAVVVSNVSAEDADVTITRGDAPVMDILVPANSVEIVPLPWVDELMIASGSKVVVDGAYRVRSSRPVTLYQYSPLEYEKDGLPTMSNDASLLMPTTVWGTDTMVIGRNTHFGNPGLYTVVAREDGTTITVTPSATGGLVRAGGGIAADGTGMVILDEGDVLQVLSADGAPPPNQPDPSDLTGTRVASDKPVMVLGGHYCTFIPVSVCCCDHLEELNLPVENLAKEYFVTTPLVKPLGENPFPKARMVRVIATTDGTTLTYDPPQNGAPVALAKAGDYAEIETDVDFKISANFKIAVSEYMLGQDAGGDTGDPAMTISVPIEQYRSSYSFHAPTNYESNFANITAPNGATVTLDGAPFAGFEPIGATGYAVARVQLPNGADGDHTISGDVAFGVQVYGYGQYTSYWYPGGLDLTLIPQ
ncbi:IgGFc-binding protein [Nannocystis sp. SCPEA4]|uniref:IgGFc-binding protein n=1 Tax=Nannocystis sp. SCPEA4 TaxID=2996787 RepID=UPI00226EAF0B|nr:IgGFc-binding protein [Nannocystis sp. SCPEA4]MCY1061799.1 IgGFc-binding protein [Nannocystis sp. SCPEA4]